MTSNESLIQQTLHGYREGHRLLAASTPLPRKVEQTMAVLSDLSGHGVLRHFDGYLTGYPLPEIGAYALAKTWLASEMPRPGCVWTHTLLIPFRRLSSVQSLQNFGSLFVRPTAGHFHVFAEPHEHMNEDVSVGQNCLPSDKFTYTGDVLCKLYESPDHAVLVPITSPARAQHAFIEIWSQQWPRLRRAFTFCTGAISGRRLDGRWFDLQGVPERKVGEVRRATPGSVVASLEAPPRMGESRRWCDVAIEDLGASTNTLRDFLFQFGAEAGGGRRDFIPMTNLFLSLNDKPSGRVDRVVKSLEALFPRSNMGVKLKARLLAGELGTDIMRAPDVRLRVVLEATDTLFEIDRDHLKGLARRAWNYNPNTTVEAIDRLKEPNGPTPSVVLAVLATIVEPDRLERPSRFENAMTLLAAHRPLILVHDAFRGMNGRNAVLLDYLGRRATKLDEARTILQQWLKEGDFESLELASVNTPNTVIPAVLDLISGPTTTRMNKWPPDLVIRLCRRNPKHAGEWLHENIRSLREGDLGPLVAACIVVAVAYQTIAIKKSNVDDWEHLLSNVGQLQADLQEVVVTRLFARAMRVRGTNGARIATAAFPHIYRFVMNSQISYTEWYNLQEETIGFSWDPDRCRRLAEGLIDQFREFKWPRKYFTNMLSNDGELASLLANTRFCRSRYKRFVAGSVE